MIQLENEHCSVAINTKGAELASFFNKQSGIEHIWQADLNYWGRHAPVLFPIVGQVEDGEYFVEGKRFELSQHGFARDMEFDVISSSKSEALFSLRFSDESLTKYPYKFELQIGYGLTKSELTISYKVLNLDDKEIFFQLGAHPGFSCPFLPEDKFEDHKVTFDKKLTEDRLLFADGLLTGEIQKEFLNEDSSIQLTRTTFDDDAIIFETENIESVSIENTKGNKLTMNMKGWPLLGIWSKPKADAPFVCLEPWFGVASVKGESKEFGEKKAIQKVATNCVFQASYSLIIE